MKDFKEQIDDFIFRRLEPDEHYNDDVRNKYSEALEQIKRLLNTEEEIKIFIEFEDTLNSSQYTYMEEAYKKGFRDGMELSNMLSKKEK